MPKLPPPVTPGYPKDIDPAKTYRVQLSKVVPFGGGFLPATGPCEMSGEVLMGILAGPHKDSVYGANAQDPE